MGDNISQKLSPIHAISLALLSSISACFPPQGERLHMAQVSSHSSAELHRQYLRSFLRVRTQQYMPLLTLLVSIVFSKTVTAFIKTANNTIVLRSTALSDEERIPLLPHSELSLLWMCRYKI